jgi:hypothetical protein
MARERFCDICKGWHRLDMPWPSSCVKEDVVAKSGLSAPMLTLDTMDPVQSQTNGKMYDSKAALRAEYKRAGVVEVGNDSSVLNPTADPIAMSKQAHKGKRVESIKRAMAQAGMGE